MKKRFLLFIILFILLFLSGCYYSQSEVDEIKEELDTKIFELDEERSHFEWQSFDYKLALDSIRKEIPTISGYINGGKVTQQEAQKSIQRIKDAFDAIEN